MHVLVLAGGRGSRSAEPSLPKILQRLKGEYRILDNLLEQLHAFEAESVTFLLGHGAAEIVVALEDKQRNFPSQISWKIEKELRGTKASILGAIEDIPADHFLIILGDVVVGGNLNNLVKRYFEAKCQIGIACHPNLHPQDSDRLLLDENFKIIDFVEKNSVREYDTGIPQTGVLIASKKSLMSLGDDGGDISSSLARHAVEESNGIGLLTSMYLKDSGTPSRLDDIRSDFTTGAFDRRASHLKPSIFLDRDGTLIPDEPLGRSHLPQNSIQHDTTAAIRKANQNGIPIFLVTNQPALAKGQITFADVHSVHMELQRQLSAGKAFIDELVFCPHHPERGFKGEVPELKIECFCRKPLAGMVDSLTSRHGIDLAESYVIGDSPVDQGLSDAIGATFLKADYMANGTVAKAINLAIQRICN